MNDTSPERLMSLVVPCYNEQEALPLFKKEADRIATILSDTYHLSVEYVFVNDGSTDGTLDELRGMASTDSRSHYLSFSRNFGKESGLYAGLRTARGDWVATLDADLQDPPSLLPKMYSLLLEHPDYDCVATERKTRQGEPVLRSLFARLFYKTINRISDTHIKDGARDFRLMSRKYVQAVLSLSEVNRFSKGIFSWVGFKTLYVDYPNVPRVAGKTSWSFGKLFRYAIDGFVDFSTKPLIVSSMCGILSCLIAFIMLIVVFVRAATHGDPVAGWPSLVCIILFIGGLQFLFIGVIGEYLAKTYTEVKNRPLYIVAESDSSRRQSENADGRDGETGGSEDGRGKSDDEHV